MKIYGNKQIIDISAEMVRKGREPHSLIIHGEKGLGKKTAARYIAAQLMCEKHTGVPCGTCRACRMIQNAAHPDLYMAQSNEKGNYTVDEIRENILGTAYIAPNEGDIKVYIIPDFDLSVSTSVQIQNILLKLIEEPPDHAVIILTAGRKEVFLDTIISRCLCLGAVNVTDAESAEYLQNMHSDSSERDIAEAVKAGHGNIGRCEAYLKKKDFYNAVQLARNLSQAYVSGSEYEMLKALSEADGKKAILREGIYLFSEIIRDACVYQLDGEMISCSREDAKAISRRLTVQSGTELYDTISKYIRRIDSNCNLTLTSNALCSFLAL